MARHAPHMPGLKRPAVSCPAGRFPSGTRALVSRTKGVTAASRAYAPAQDLSASGLVGGLAGQGVTTRVPDLGDDQRSKSAYVAGWIRVPAPDLRAPPTLHPRAGRAG